MISEQGSIELANSVWKVVERFIPDKQKAYIALQLIDTFEHYGCTNIYEAVDLANAANVNFQFVDED